MRTVSGQPDVGGHEEFKQLYYEISTIYIV